MHLKGATLKIVRVEVLLLGLLLLTEGVRSESAGILTNGEGQPLLVPQ